MTSDKDVCKYRNRGMHDRREGMPGKADTRYWHPTRMQYMSPGTIRRLCGCRCGLYRILPDAFAACVTTGYALRYACACPVTVWQTSCGSHILDNKDVKLLNIIFIPYFP